MTFIDVSYPDQLSMSYVLICNLSHCFTTCPFFQFCTSSIISTIWSMYLFSYLFILPSNPAASIAIIYNADSFLLLPFSSPESSMSFFESALQRIRLLGDSALHRRNGQVLAGTYVRTCVYVCTLFLHCPIFYLSPIFVVVILALGEFALFPPTLLFSLRISLSPALLHSLLPFPFTSVPSSLPSSIPHSLSHTLTQTHTHSLSLTHSLTN